MSEPSELERLDPSGASEDLAGAPEMVRRADVWLQDHASRTGRRAVRVFVGMSPFLGIFGALPVVSLSGSEPLGAAAMMATWAVGALAGFAMWRSWGRTEAWASGTVGRYRQLLADHALLGHRAPPNEGSSSVGRMAERIAALAGDRVDLREAARAAAAHLRELESELAHLGAAATGNPEADAVLDAARDRIRATIAQTQARIAELYAGVLEARSDTSAQVADRVDESLARLQADLEVEERMARARAAARSRQAQ